MSKDHESRLLLTDMREQRKDIGRFWLPARQILERREKNQPAEERSREMMQPVSIGGTQRRGRVTEIMEDVLTVLEEISQTIASTARVAQLPQERAEQLQDLVQSIRAGMERLLQKLHRSGDA